MGRAGATRGSRERWGRKREAVAQFCPLIHLDLATSSDVAAVRLRVSCYTTGELDDGLDLLAIRVKLLADVVGGYDPSHQDPHGLESEMATGADTTSEPESVLDGNLELGDDLPVRIEESGGLILAGVLVEVGAVGDLGDVAQDDGAGGDTVAHVDVLLDGFVGNRDGAGCVPSDGLEEDGGDVSERFPVLEVGEPGAASDTVDLLLGLLLDLRVHGHAKEEVGKDRGGGIGTSSVGQHGVTLDELFLSSRNDTSSLGCLLHRAGDHAWLGGTVSDCELKTVVEAIDQILDLLLVLDCESLETCTGPAGGNVLQEGEDVDEEHVPKEVAVELSHELIVESQVRVLSVQRLVVAEHKLGDALGGVRADELTEVVGGVAQVVEEFAGQVKDGGTHGLDLLDTEKGVEMLAEDSPLGAIGHHGQVPSTVARKFVIVNQSVAVTIRVVFRAPSHKIVGGSPGVEEDEGLSHNANVHNRAVFLRPLGEDLRLVTNFRPVPDVAHEGQATRARW